MKSLKISSTPRFAKDLKALAKKYKSINEDLSALLSELRENPRIGASLGANFYKIRLKIKSKNKGKSGGARVIDYVCEINNDNIEIYLLGIYDKSDLSGVDIEIYKDYIKEIL